MKRVLAMTMALVLVFLVVPDLGLEASASYGWSVEMRNGADILDDGEISWFGNRVLGTGNISVEIPVLWQGFDYIGGAVGSDAAIDQDVMNRMELVFDPPSIGIIFRERHKIHYEGGRQAKFILVAENIGEVDGYVYIKYTDSNYNVTTSKRYKIEGQVIDPTVNKKITALTGKSLKDLEVRFNGSKINKDMVENLGTIAPSSELWFHLNTEYFVWDPLIAGMDTSVRKSTLDNNHVGVDMSVATGSRLIEDVEIRNVDGSAWVVVEFKEAIPMINEKDFAFTVYLTFEGKRDKNSKVDIAGTMANEEIIVDGQEYVYLGDGAVAVTEEATQRVELDLGNGVSAFKNLSKNRRYFGMASSEKTNDDYDIMEYYPSVRKVLNLKTVNISGSGSFVKINPTFSSEDYGDDTPLNPNQVYYVYGADGKYLGNTDEYLPYRDKYYLSSSLISLEGASETVGGFEADEDDLYDDDDDYQDNLTHNPGTGDDGAAPSLFLPALLLLALGMTVKFTAKGESR